MKRTCLACHKPLVGSQRKWCSNACTQRAAFNKKAGRPLDARTWIPGTICNWCQGEISNRGPQARYCSNRCRLDAGHHAQLVRRHRDQQSAGLPIPGQLIVCRHPKCQVSFIKKHSQLYCSKECAVDANWRYRSPNGFGDRCAVYFKPCHDCNTLITRKARGGMVLCEPCRKVRLRAVDARRNHKRRAVGAATMNIKELAARDGERCHICSRKIDLSLSGMAKWGPTIDHILPVSLGGTNDPNNLTLAHRCCNTRRGNREPAQMLLSA